MEWFSFAVFWTPRKDCEEAGTTCPRLLPIQKEIFGGHNSAVRMWPVLWVTSHIDKKLPLLEYIQMIPDRLPYVKSKQPGQSSHNLDLSYSYLLNQNKFPDGLVQKPQLSQRPEASRLLEQPNSLSVSAIAGCPHSCFFLTIKVYCSNIPTIRHYLSCKILLAAHLGMKSLYFTL